MKNIENEMISYKLLVSNGDKLNPLKGKNINTDLMPLLFPPIPNFINYEFYSRKDYSIYILFK